MIIIKEVKVPIKIKEDKKLNKYKVNEKDSITPKGFLDIPNKV